MVLVQNKYKNTLVGVLWTKITFVTHSSPSCYFTLCTRSDKANLGPQKTDSGTVSGWLSGSHPGWVIPKTIINIVQTASLHGTQWVRVGVWQCSLTV